jgi:NitT/TauT family transport system permease protein
MLDLMHSLRASEIVTFRRLRVPIAMPYLFTGCKIAISFAVVGAVIGEFVAAQEGLGYMILMSTAQAKTPLAFACLVALTIISVVLFYAIELLEKRFVTWSP